MPDTIGRKVHLALAAAFLFLVPVSTFAKDPAFILLIGWALIRSPGTWRSYRVLLRDPIVPALVAWAAWETASLLWSPLPGEGVEELRVFRFLLIPLALWPVLDRAGWLVAAFLLGILSSSSVFRKRGPRANSRGPQGVRWEC